MLTRQLNTAKWSLTAIIACALTVFCVSVAVAALEDLENLADGLKIDKTQISVSGISSGGFMAHQFHVVHSPHVMGVGVVAGGPYYCARGSMLDAVTRCSQFVELECTRLLALFGLDTGTCEQGFVGPKENTESQEMAKASFTEAVEKNGQDFMNNMKSDKVYIFSGLQDTIISGGVMDAVFHFYVDPDKGKIDEKQVRYNDEFPVRHAMVRDHRIGRPPLRIVNECNQRPDDPAAYDTYIDDCQNDVAPLLEQCNCRDVPGEAGPACAPTDPTKQESCEDANDVDLAGAILNHIYGELNDRAVVDKDNIHGFDQKQIFRKFSSTPSTDLQFASMAREGYVFIPEACGSGNECKLHVAFHGCLQGDNTGELTGDSGNLFSQYAGYNEWAKANNMVVLYPQVRRWNGSIANPPINPQGCWDWWGQYYTHENYHTKSGIQTKAVAQMINVLLGEDLLEVPAAE